MATTGLSNRPDPRRRRAVAALNDPDVERALAERRAWRVDGAALVRELTFRDSDEAMCFVEQIAREAVDYRRRPDICVWDNRVRMTASNPRHAALTLAEVRLAAKVDDVIEQRRSGTDSGVAGRPPKRAGQEQQTADR